MRQEIRLGGFGGQGIVLAGHIIGRAALSKGGHVVMTQSYGPEMRGGRVAADVILDSEPIDYPKVLERPEISVFMFQEAYEYYHHDIGPILIYDEDLVQPDAHARAYPIWANRTAEELGRRVVANIVMLGSFTALTGLIPPEVMEQAVLATVPKKALDLNKEAFHRGLEYGMELLEERE
jgi:2-oxoglutarate ferredoxin oxidoreductase subunit gamma